MGQSRSASVAVLPGDGIGPEVTKAATDVMRRQAERHGLALRLTEHLCGGAALESRGTPLPEDVLQACLAAGAVFLGAVGDPRYDREPASRRPERALLELRRRLEVYANLRPIQPQSALADRSPLRTQAIDGVDILFVRELTGGIYFGEPRGLEERDGRRVAFDTEVYSDFEIVRIARVAFQAAGARRRRVTSVDKANVLTSSRLWRSVVEEVAADYPDISLDHMLVDNCAMQLIRDPSQFDVILTSNMFGDILSDEASMLVGSLGLLPSASLGEIDGRRSAMYEPVHGSAPDIAGTDSANPLGAILSAAMLFRHSLACEAAASEIEDAVARVLAEGWRTSDIGDAEAAKTIGTREMTERLLESLGQMHSR